MAQIAAKTKQPLKQLLNVGCGPRGQHHRMPGFDGWQETRLDIDASLDPDVVGSMTDMSALATASMDAIVSSHNIERLSPHQVPLALAEFRRVLREDGIVVITCPDLQSVAARVAVGELVTPLYQSPAGPIAAIDILYGLRPAMAAGKDYMAHRCGFTLQVLIDTLHAAGFPHATGMALAESFDLWVVASKHPCSDEKLLALAKRHLPANSAEPRGQRELELRAVRLQRDCQANPQDPVALHNYGETLRLLKRFDDAGRIFKRVLESTPAFLPSYVSLKPILLIAHAQALAENDPSKGLMALRELSMFCSNQGNAYLDAGAGETATACYREALFHFPQNSNAMSNLGNVLRQAGHLSEAEYWCRACLAINPNLAAAWNNLGAVLSSQGLFDEAQTCYERALSIDPHMSGPKHNASSGALFNMQMAPHISEVALFEKHKAWGTLHQADGVAASAEPRVRKRHKKLRVGYLSADFREHAMRHFLEPILAHHDRDQFDVYCYAQVPTPDTYTERFRSYRHVWRWIHLLSDEQLDQQIRADEIDVLVDCMGHTHRTRLMALKNKPAPVMMTWLGYLGTSGLPCMDYRLTDEWVDPAGLTDAHHTETLLRVPGGMLSYQPHDRVPDVQALPALSRGYVTFGSLNSLEKLNAEVVKAWATILLKCPLARLVLQTKALLDAGRRSWVMGAFEVCGVDPRRITLKSAEIDFLETYHSIDIALDTFPYGGGATTCDALWMGVPVVTWSGRRSAGRLTTSLLHQIGRPDWVTETLDGYVSKACELASDLNALSQERVTLRARIQQSPLCDQRGFVVRLEALFKSADVATV